MPSFRTLPDDQIDALVDYVKYLTIRGQTERLLLTQLNGRGGAPLVDLSLLTAEDGEPSDEDLELFEEQAYEIFGDGLLEGIVYRWLKRDKKVTEIPPAPAMVDPSHDDHQELVDAGRQLFYTKGNCLQCHGETGMGDGQTGTFDDWTNEWIKSSGVDPFDPSTFSDFLAVGALSPRPIMPRNLNKPIYKGGDRANQIYLRLANGIEGTPMPSSAALTPDEIWAIVAYVKALPYEASVASQTHKKINQQQIAK